MHIITQLLLPFTDLPLASEQSFHHELPLFPWGEPACWDLQWMSGSWLWPPLCSVWGTAGGRHGCPSMLCPISPLSKHKEPSNSTGSLLTKRIISLHIEIVTNLIRSPNCLWKWVQRFFLAHLLNRKAVYVIILCPSQYKNLCNVLISTS